MVKKLKPRQSQASRLPKKKGLNLQKEWSPRQLASSPAFRKANQVTLICKRSKNKLDSLQLGIPKGLSELRNKSESQSRKNPLNNNPRSPKQATNRRIQLFQRKSKDRSKLKLNLSQLMRWQHFKQNLQKQLLTNGFANAASRLPNCPYWILRRKKRTIYRGSTRSHFARDALLSATWCASEDAS